MEIRVYYEDTDCGGVVYYANYLKFMERSRTEYLRDRGIDLANLQQQTGMFFVVVDVHARYRKPAHYNDLLTVTSTITVLTQASVTFATTICLSGGELLVTGVARLACISSPQGRAIRIPEAVYAVLHS